MHSDETALTLVQQTPDDDVYRTGPTPGGTLYVIPGIWSSMPSDLLALVRARRMASITGVCPLCGAMAQAGMHSRTIAHEDFCGTSDDYLGPKLTAWARDVGRYARGRRITEDPTA